MKIERHINLMIAGLFCCLLFSCEKKEDYSHIVFRNYLHYAVNRASGFLAQVSEGSEEGEYAPGSKLVYQQVIDEATAVDEDPASTQEEVDLAYQSLLQAGEAFSDQMVPFRSDFQEIIDYANILYDITDEGEEEGNARPGSKEQLNEAIDAAEELISREDLTQRMADQGTIDLSNAIISFNNQIIGQANTALINGGFELPGYETEDFSEVDGWSTYGKVEDWAPKAAVAVMESASEGSHVARIGSYTQGVYQTVFELLQPNATYTLEFDVSLTENSADWQGKKYPAILRTRIFVFEERDGFYDLITILAESYDTLGIDPGDFRPISHAVKVDATSASLGKKVSVDFSQRHTWDAENPVWAESFAAIDNVKLKRDQ